MSDQATNSKNILIGGAAGALGKVLGATFVREGHHIAGLARKGATVADGVDLFEADLTDEDSVSAAFQQILSEWGTPDVYIHAAGGWDAAPLLYTSLSDWQNMLDRNLTSAFLCFREAVRLMEPQGGVLIGFASRQGYRQAPGCQGAYAASKAGLIRLMEAIGDEYEDSGIRCHVIAPSYIRYDEEDETRGVEAGHLAHLCLQLSGETGAALRGGVIEAYGEG